MPANDELMDALCRAYNDGIHDAPNITSRADWQRHGLLAVARVVVQRANAEIEGHIDEVKTAILQPSDAPAKMAIIGALIEAQIAIRALLPADVTASSPTGSPSSQAAPEDGSASPEDGRTSRTLPAPGGR